MKVTERVFYIIPPHHTNHIEIYIQHSGCLQGAVLILSRVVVNDLQNKNSKQSIDGVSHKKG